MLKHLKLENIRSYKRLDISFNKGVTVVSGANGSGKSSLLEACFMGLFGSKTLDRDFVLSDIITKGATKASILLEFEQNDHNYSVEQSFRNDPEKDRASNTRSIFRRDGEILFDQATRSYDAVTSLLNMDEEAYRNCVYIRQGEIDILINSKPRERQKMIDDLLKLGKLEEYRERASNARIGVGRHQRDNDNRIKELGKELRQIEDSDPNGRLAALRTRSEQIDAELSSLYEKRDRTLSLIEEVRKTLSELKELSGRKETISSRIKDINEKRSGSYRSIETLSEDIRSKREQVVGVRQGISDIGSKLNADPKDTATLIEKLDEHERCLRDSLSDIKSRKAVCEKDILNMAQSLKDGQKNLSSLEDSLKDIQHRIKTVDSQIQEHKLAVSELESRRKDTISTISSLGFSLEKLENIDDVLDLVNDQQKRLYGREAGLKAKISELKSRLEKSVELLGSGKCPTCGQDLKGSHVEESTFSDKETLSKLQEELSGLNKDQYEIQVRTEKVRSARKSKYDIDKILADINSKKDAITRDEKRIDEYRLSIKDYEGRIKEIHLLQEDLEGKITRIKEETTQIEKEEKVVFKEHSEVIEKLRLAREMQKAIEESEKIDSMIKQMADRIKGIQEMISIFDVQLEETKDSLHEIEEKMGGFNRKELESLSEKYDIAFKEINSRIDKLKPEKDEVMKKAGMAEHDRRRLSDLKRNLNILDNRGRYLYAVYSDAEKLENMYMSIRARLRLDNIQTLDMLINDIFSFMYTNNAYSHVKLDADYNLTVFEKDGTTLEPKLLSGGERALFNLVLRCAIYRLLSLGASNQDGRSLPPLIMDEPTVFLDRGHVHQLIKLIDMMRDIGVAQILIVSHDESLIDSADNVFAVEKDPVTNTSGIYAI